jgi:hypothetical protein
MDILCREKTPRRRGILWEKPLDPDLGAKEATFGSQPLDLSSSVVNLFSSNDTQKGAE